MEQSKAVQIIILLSAIVIGGLFATDIRNDYYYTFTKEKAIASIKNLNTIEENNPYLLAISYFNKYSNFEVD